MSISRKITRAALAAFLVLLPAVGMSQSNNCRMIAETDAEYGSLARDVRLYVPEAAGMVICKGAGSAASMVSPYMVTRITTVNTVRAFRFEIPYLYRDRFPASSGLQKYLYDGGNGQTIQFICLIQGQCDKFFDTGFAVVDEEIDEAQYPALVDIWAKANINKEILAFHGPISGDADEMKDFVKSGGVFLPLGMTLDVSDGHLKRLYMWVYGLQGGGTRREWALSFEMRQDKLSIVDVSLSELE